MTRRRDPAAHLRGNILDPLPGQEHLEGLTILQLGVWTSEQRKPKPDPACRCMPNICRPALMADGDRLLPVCRVCRQALISGVHRRREQTHVIGLAELPMDHLDLAELEEVGLLMESPLKAGQGPLAGRGLFRDPERFDEDVAEALRLLDQSPLEAGEVPQAGLC